MLAALPFLLFADDTPNIKWSNERVTKVTTEEADPNESPCPRICALVKLRLGMGVLRDVPSFNLKIKNDDNSEGGVIGGVPRPGTQYGPTIGLHVGIGNNWRGWVVPFLGFDMGIPIRTGYPDRI